MGDAIGNSPWNMVKRDNPGLDEAWVCDASKASVIQWKDGFAP